MTPAIEAEGLVKDVRRDGVPSTASTSRSNAVRCLRPPRPQRRRQDDDDQHPHDAHTARRRAPRPSSASMSSATLTRSVGGSASRARTRRSTRADRHREPRDDRPTCRGSPPARGREARPGSCSSGSTWRMPPTASDEDLLGRDAPPPRPRIELRRRPRRSCSSTSRRRAWTRAAGVTCWISSDASGRRHDGPAHDAVSGGGGPTGRPHRRARRRACPSRRAPPDELKAMVGGEVLDVTVTRVREHRRRGGVLLADYAVGPIHVDADARLARRAHEPCDRRSGHDSGRRARRLGRASRRA